MYIPLSLFAWFVFGTEFYVSSSLGNDANTGLNPTLAFQTLGKASLVANQPGDTVHVMNGIYRNTNFGQGRTQNNHAALQIRFSGSEAGHIVWKAYEGHTPKIEFDGSGGIYFPNGIRYVIVDGFEIEGPAKSITFEVALENRYRNSATVANNYISNRGIYGWGPHDNIIIRNCFVHDTSASGIRFNDGDYMEISNCTVARTCWWSSSAESAIVFAESAPIDGSTDVKMIFRNNLVYDNMNRIPFYQPSHQGLNGFSNYGESSQDYILDGQGLYVTRSLDNYAGTFLFEDNVMVNNGKNGINFDGSPSAKAIIRHNTMYLNGAFDVIQSNYPGPNKVAGIAMKHVREATIENNIIMCRNSAYSAISVWDDSPTLVRDNVIYDCSINLRTPHVNTISGNPAFVHPSTDVNVADFRLQPGSPARGFGAFNDQDSRLVYGDDCERLTDGDCGSNCSRCQWSWMWTSNWDGPDADCRCSNPLNSITLSTSPTLSPSHFPTSVPTQTPTSSPSHEPIWTVTASPDIDSSQGHFTSCGRPGQCLLGTSFVSNAELRAVRCISDIEIVGWHHNAEEASCADRWESLWWESDIWGDCKVLNYEDASSFCTSFGARLPTLTEVEDGCVANSGCNYDVQSIWTSSGDYVLGERGDKRCPENYEPVTSVHECESVSMALGISWSGRFDSNEASVCFVCAGCNPINLRVTSSHGANADWVCKRKSDRYFAFQGCNSNGAISTQAPDFFNADVHLAEVQCCSLDGSACTRHFAENQECLSGANDAVKMTWTEAELICESEGLRLCNSQEEINKCCSSGCGHDSQLVWSGSRIQKAEQHYASCGRPQKCSSGTTLVNDDAIRALRCVSDVHKIGWFHAQQYNSCDTSNIWWESDIWGECKMLNFQDAMAFCALQHARLPTLQEVENGCVANSGCGYDSKAIWTSTSSF